MKELLPIAHFECLQTANWSSGRATLDAFEICSRVAPIRDNISNTPIETLLNSEFILELGTSFADRLDGCNQPKFDKPLEWKNFLDEWTVEFTVNEMPFSEVGPYVLATLFNSHLTTIRLLISWTIVGAIGQAMQKPPLVISREGIGRLIEDLSFGGAPIYDVEGMRSDFPDRYCYSI